MNTHDHMNEGCEVRQVNCGAFRQRKNVQQVQPPLRHEDKKVKQAVVTEANTLQNIPCIPFTLCILCE